MRTQQASDHNATRALCFIKQGLTIMSLLQNDELSSIEEQIVEWARPGDNIDLMAAQLIARICQLYKDTE